MRVHEKKNGFVTHPPHPCNTISSFKKEGLIDSKQKELPQSKSAIEPTREIWKSARARDGEHKIFEDAQKRAREAMRLPEGATLKNPEKSQMRIDIRPDMRNKNKTEYEARIISNDGVIRAEVWGTKSGKARSYCDPLNNDDSDPDGLDNEGKEQLKKALYGAREIVTEKKEYASADESGPESGSDTSDNDI